MNLTSFSSKNKQKLPEKQGSFYVIIYSYKTENGLSTKLKPFISGGEGGIRTLDALLTHTRVPVVRHKPG